MATLAESIPGRNRIDSRLAFGVLCVVTGSLIVAGLAQISVKLPFTPVPVTGQTLGVLLVGASLGLKLGSASLLLYLAEGAIGLPFFAGGAHGFSVLAPASATGGYLWGFVVASAVVGWLSQRGWDRSIRSAIGAMFLGEVVLYATALPWLMAALDVPLDRGLILGLAPFIPGDALKLLLAAGLLPGAWRLLGRRPNS
jgi:biotin transport system substrate-specific component